MSKLEVDQITQQSGTTVTVGGGACKTAVVDATTVTLGRSGGTVSLASGASQSGFGRTGTVDWDTTPKTASFTAVSGNGYFVNTTSSALTVTLPASPSAGDIVAISDYAGTAETNNITIGRNSSNIEGEASDSTISTNKASRTLVYVDGTQGWKLVNDATQALITTYDAHYFVLAGGGGGGAATGSNTWGTGGGGGGGFRNSYDSPLAAPGCGVNVVVGNSFPITVGAGGASGPTTAPGIGVNGSPSVFSTITSTGGGGGVSATPGTTGQPGGSGGGGAYGQGDNALPGGTGNTPPVSPPQGQNGGAGQSCYGRGQGGGGAGGAAPGGNSPGGTNDGGPGGPGVATSISGSPTTKAAGGKGGSYQNSPGGAGSEPANSGNGGAGTGGGPRGAADGGSGIVIIRYTTADAPSSASGGTKTTSGSDTIHTFTGPGTFTA